MTEVVLTKPTYTESAISSATMTEVSAYSKNNTDLPHMLPEPIIWEKIISSLGISNNDRIII